MSSSDVTNSNQNGETRSVVVTRIFQAPVERVWKAWIDPEMVMQWWGPAGFTSPLAKMDFREGGTSLVCMRAPIEYGGQDTYSTWAYDKIVPHKQIEYTFHFADRDGNTLAPAEAGVPPGVPEDGHHVVVFRDLSDNWTEMTVTERGYTTDEAHALSKAGLEQCLDKMAAIFVKNTGRTFA